MRVISGKARRIRLKTIEGNNTRPTTDRIKETLFNILQSDIYEATFLDLFSGSGGIGIEALSRGAKCAVFIENSSEAVKCIKDNLYVTKLLGQAEIIKADARSAIRQLKGREPFSIVYMDPPYHEGHEEPVLTELINAKLVDEDSIIVVEAALDTELDFLDKIDLEIEREKRYKTNKHFFLKYIGE